MLRRVHGVEIELRVEGAIGGEPERDAAVLRIAHEALHNALRHAGAQQVAVRVEQGDGALVVEVRDDGVGFEPDRAELRSRHLGLTSMEERAKELGGHLEIRSAPGRGTVVRLEVAA
jgi:signal transduction histidine kinase